MPKNEVNIKGTKAVIYQNDYGVWQFRIWLADEDKYFRQSLRTKNKEDAIEKGEELFWTIKLDKKNGKKIYSISIAKAVQKYIEYRKNDVGIDGDGGIVIGRWKTIITHLNHFLNYVKKDAKVKELGTNTLISYQKEGVETSYYQFRKQQKAADATIRNEMASINACMTYLYEHDEKLSDIPTFKLPKIKLRTYTIDGEEIRRQTFTPIEWKSFYTAMRTYAAKAHNKDTDTYYEKQLVRHFLLFMANSGMRSGELRQLRFKNVSVEKHVGIKQETYLLARVYVERETTKVRIPRTFHANAGKYIERWKKICEECGRDIRADDLVFSRDGVSEYTNRILHTHFNRIMEMTSIAAERRDALVPYSLRHMYITNMSLAGASFDKIAEHCGTSVHQIERTYKHISEDEQRSFATMRYVNINGNIVPTSDLYGD